MISMTETQVIFRVDKEMLKNLDKSLLIFGFKTRNEWFRAKVREAIEKADKKGMMRKLGKLSVEGITEEEIVQMVKEWRKRKGNN